MERTSKETYSDVPIRTQSLFVMAFVTDGDKTDPKRPSLKMSIFTALTYWQWFSFDFLCTGISLKFHCWDWDLAKKSGWEMGFGQNLGWEMGFIPPPPPALQDPHQT